MCSSPKSSGNTFRVRRIEVHENYSDRLKILKKASEIFDKKERDARKLKTSGVQDLIK